MCCTNTGDRGISKVITVVLTYCQEKTEHNKGNDFNTFSGKKKKSTINPKIPTPTYSRGIFKSFKKENKRHLVKAKTSNS